MKQQRLISILQLLENAHISSQDELRQKLALRGFNVTQATLSRDVRELGLIKGPAGYAMATVGGSNEAPGVREVLRSFGLEARLAMNQIVIITTTGGAQPVAATIDDEDWPEVVGTIAGDDTVLVICPDDGQARALCSRIEAYIG